MTGHADSSLRDVRPDFLDGVTVVEVGSRYAASYAARLLAGLGARVTRVVGPGAEEDADLVLQPGLREYLDIGKEHVAAGSDTGALAPLLSQADIVIESTPDGQLGAGLGLEDLLSARPDLVIVSVTPFGRSGPHRDWIGPEMIAFHASGWAYVCPSYEAPDLALPPLNAPSHGGAFLAGEGAALACVQALLSRDISGRGAHIDFSEQESIAADNQPRYNVIEAHGTLKRTVSTVPGNAVVCILPCRDGAVAVSAREEHQWRSFVAAMGSPEWCADERFAKRAGRDRHWPEVYEHLAAWSSSLDRAAVLDFMATARVAAFPLGRADDLLSSEQLRSRDFFTQMATREGKSIEVPDRAYRVMRQAVSTAGSTVKAGSAERPLEGIRIVDFSWVLAGPTCTKYLAALGAEVIKVESSTRPDLSKRDRAWEEINVGKRSLTLDLKQPDALEIMTQLLTKSDVVVENFSTGVMGRLGFDYDRMLEINPNLTILSMSGFGRRGPQATTGAYGTLIQCLTGFAELASHPGYPVASPGGPWTDPLAGVLAALLISSSIRARRQGKAAGCFFDLSMVEATMTGLPEPLLAHQISGEEARPRGNRDPRFAPQGCYPTKGDDRWIAISVTSDAAWRALADRIGKAELDDPALATTKSRRQAADWLDARIAAWTRGQDAEELAAELQAAGISAHLTVNPATAYLDPQLDARRFFAPVPTLAGGERLASNVPWRVDGHRPAALGRPPDLGEANEYVLSEVLGLPAEAVHRLLGSEAMR